MVGASSRSTGGHHARRSVLTSEDQLRDHAHGSGLGDLRIPVPVSVTNGGGAPRPNIVIIMTDDQRWDTITTMVMPRLRDRMVAGSNAVYLRNAFVSNPLCCPSRVTTLTGKYSDSTGVYGNQGSFSGGVGRGGGGFESFDDDPSVNPTIATDLHRAGYRTALIGKYLNHYPSKRNWTYVPPGWDRWFAVASGSYYDYRAASDGHLRRFGDDRADYSTRVLAQKAISFIQKSRATDEPFFLYFAPAAPHSPAIAGRRDAGRFDRYVDSYRWPDSVGEANVSDKPAYMRKRGWSYTLQRRYDHFHARQLSAIYGVDRAVAHIWKALPDNTVVLYMGDNGMAWGEHRWSGKLVPYNESIRVPMILATKGLGLPDIDPTRLALNVDVRATLESFAGRSPATMGLDWTDPTQTRDAFVLEHWNLANVPTYCGVRSTEWMYVRYSTGQEELYDERSDPLELTNIASTRPPELATLRTRAAALCTQGTSYPPDWPFLP
jgi:arylsulfatase A-like enzyme